MTWWLPPTKICALRICFVGKYATKQRDWGTVCWPIGLVLGYGCPGLPCIPLSIGNIPWFISCSCLSTACESAAWCRSKLQGRVLTIKHHRQSSPSLSPASLHHLCPHKVHSWCYPETKRNNLSNTLVRKNHFFDGKNCQRGSCFTPSLSVILQ